MRLQRTRATIGMTLLLLGSILGLHALFGASAANAQTGTPESSEQNTDTIDPQVVDMRLELERLRSEIQDVRSRLNSILLPLSVVVSGGIVLGGLVTVRSERRNSQLQELAVTGETLSQARAEATHANFLEASQKTMNLVNETLRLATEAGQRAEESMKLKAQESLEEIEVQARDVLGSALVGDFKAIVEREEIRRPLLEIAAELGSIEGFLHLQQIKLTPVCLFVKGMSRHLSQAAEPAIRNLREAARQSDEPDLSALSLFWIGYEQNNLGKYELAREAFRRALQVSSSSDPGAQHYELERIILESRFFQLVRDWDPGQPKQTDELEALVVQAEDLSNRVPSSGDTMRVSKAVRRTLANILSWQWKTQARVDSLERAFSTFESIGDRDFGAVFGAAEMIYEREDRLVDVSRFTRAVDLVAGELRHRVEPRTLTLLRSTLLIAQTRLAEAQAASSDVDPLRDLERSYREVMTELSKVDSRLTVFSPFTKANVDHDTFAQELESFHEESKRALGQGNVR